MVRNRTQGFLVRAGSFALVGGLVSLIGWAADVRRLTDWFNNGISIQPNTTVAVMAAGAALILFALDARRAVLALGILIALLGATALVQYLTAIDLPALNTALMFGRTWGRTGVVSAGRMGPPGAACWTLLGTGFVLLAVAPRARPWVPVLGLVTLGIGMLAVTGYLYGAHFFFSRPQLTVIALQTAIFLVVVSAAIIVAVPEYGPMRLLSDEGTAGYIARRATPLILLVAFALGLLRLLGEQAGIYDLATGTAARTIAESALLLGLLGWSLVTIRRQENILRDSRRALAEADRRKDEFLATLAHELRGPLAPMRNTLEILKRAGGTTPLEHQARETMQRQLSQLTRLVDDLIDVSRITHDKIELRKQDIELGPVIHQALETSQPIAVRNDLRIRVRVPDEPIYLNADPVRLTQVFGNVLSNACKYTPSGGEIWVDVERNGSEAVVRIKDTGVGIPADQLERIFDVFTQVDVPLERRQGGLGIGLTIVKRLVDLHGGRVSAASEGPHRGTEITVGLPAARVSDRGLRAPSSPAISE